MFAIQCLLVTPDPQFAGVLEESVAENNHVQLHQWVQSGSLAIHELETHAINIALIDASLPDISCFKLAEIILNTQPGVKVLIISNTYDGKLLKKLLEQGVHGFIQTDVLSPAELANTMLSAHAGMTIYPPEVIPILLDKLDLHRGIVMSQFAHIKALIIDDDMDSIGVLSVMLEQSHIEVAVISEPDSIEQHLDHPPFLPDIVFLDLEMGETSGYDVLSELMDRADYANIPIVAHSIHHDHLLTTQQAGFHSFIGKPADFDCFTSYLSSILAGEHVWEV